MTIEHKESMVDLEEIADSEKEASIDNQPFHTIIHSEWGFYHDWKIP